MGFSCLQRVGSPVSGCVGFLLRWHLLRSSGSRLRGSRGASSVAARGYQRMGSAVAHRLSCPVESSQSEGGTHVSCIGRWIPNLWTATEALLTKARLNGMQSSLEVPPYCNVRCLLALPKSPQKDTAHPLNISAIKGCKVSEEKLQFVQTHAWYLGHLISEQRIHPDPDRPRGISNSPDSSGVSYGVSFG